MPNPLDDIIVAPEDDPAVGPNGRIRVTPEGSGGNSLERNLQAAAPTQEDLPTLLGRLKDYLLNPEGFSAGNPTANRAVNRLLGTGGEERVQMWPERMVRSGLSLPGDVMSGQEPFYTTDPVTGEQTISPRVIERSMDTAGLAVPGGLANRPGAATLGSGPVRQAAAMPKAEAPVFYSALEHVATNAPQDVMAGPQWLGWLKKQPGVKQEELQWTGLPEWLEGQKGKVRKEDVQRYLDEHKVEIKDVTKKGHPEEEDGDWTEHSMNLSEEHASQVMKEEFDKLPASERAKYNNDVDEWVSAEGNEHLLDRHGDIAQDWLDENGEFEGGHYESTAGGPKYAKYQLPGGENYREHLLTLPYEKKGVTPREGETAMEMLDRAQKEHPAPYKSSHWDEPNVLAHVRTNDRVTPRDNKGLLPEDREALDSFRGEYRKLMDDYEKKWKGKWDDPARPTIHQYTQGPEFKALEKRFANYDLDRLRKLEEHGDTDLVPTLHVEEIQSDWHQEGRKKGYNDPKAPKAADLERSMNIAYQNLAAKLKEAQPALDQRAVHRLADSLIDNIREGNRDSFHTPEEHTLAKEFVDREAKYLGHSEAGERSRVPDAPFKTSWPELALKRMIRMAAEEGKERISWTPGEAQAARYDLSKQVSLLSGNKQPDGRWLVYAEDKTGSPLFHRQNGWSDHGQKVMTEEELANTVGKEAADKIVNGKPNKEGWVDLRGSNLKVGGEGMKGFYDNMLPKMVEKLGKAHGVKVKKTTVHNPESGIDGPYKIRQADDGGGGFHVIDKHGEAVHAVPSRKDAQAWIDEQEGNHEVWYFDIPKAWRDQALGKGFPLYMHGVPFPLTPVDYDPFAKKEKK